MGESSPACNRVVLVDDHPIVRMSELGLRQLPVVPESVLKPVGLLRRSDVLEAYTMAVSEARPATSA